ncbi:MAG: MMPL family transporter [Pseudomonadales bacterium]
MYFLQQSYRRLILGHPLLCLLLIAGLVGCLAVYIPSGKLDASADALVLEGDTDLAYSRLINTRYGSSDFLLVTYAPQGDLYSDETLARIASLRDELLAVETVSSINSVLDVPLLYSPPVSLTEISKGMSTLSQESVDRELARAEFASSPIYRGMLTNADASITVLQVILARDEQYFELLEQRESLRELRRSGGLSSEQEVELANVTQIFKDYAVEVNDRQIRVVAAVRAILDSYRDKAEIFLGGVPMIAVDMIAFVQSDLAVFGSGILIFIIVLMVVIFRRVQWVILPLVICCTSVTLMLGWLAFIDWRMTVISSNFVAILLIVNMSILIHLMVRYRELAAQGDDRNQEELVWETVRSMARPCLYTTLTTLVAFASLVVSGIRPVIDFGWMMTLGVSSALILSFVILPAALMLLPREQRQTRVEGKPFTLFFAGLTEHHGRKIIVLFSLLLISAVYGITQLQVENRFIDYFDESTEIYQGMETVDAQLGGTIPLDVIIDADPQVLADMQAGGAVFNSDFEEGFDDLDELEAPVNLPPQELAIDEELDGFDDEFDESFESSFDDDSGASPEALNYWFTVSGMRQITKVHEYLDGLEQTGKVLSLATLYEVLGDLMGRDIDDIQLSLAQRNLPEEVGDVLVNPYYSAENHQLRFSVRVMETSRSLRRDELLQKIRHDLVAQLGFKEEQVHLTGMLVLYNNMLQSLYRSQILSLGAVFATIMLMFFVLFRSLKLSIIAITPNVLAAGIVLGGMGLAGIPLDMMTITIAAICIGIGVDNTIHYIHRYRYEFSQDQNYVAAMYRSHGSIGKAMYYTSVIIIFGFAILALSNFRPSIYFGLLTGVAMVAALIGALLLLPRLILIFKPFGQGAQ